MPFYMTYSRGGKPPEIVRYVERFGVPLLTTATGRWSDHTDSFKDMFEYRTRHAIDSSGYSVISSWVRDRVPGVSGKLSVEDVESSVTGGFPYDDGDKPFYPWSVREYHNWLDGHKGEVDWAAVMDYQCGRVFDPLMTVEERIEATVENTVEHFNLNPDYELVPVLQGRSAEGYIQSYRMLEDRGIPLSKVGLGTLLGMPVQKVLYIEDVLREKFPEIDHIHAFGVKAGAFKEGSTFESADTNSWAAPLRYGKVYVGDRYGLDEADASEFENPARESFVNYYRYVSALHKHRGFE